MDFTQQNVLVYMSLFICVHGQQFLEVVYHTERPSALDPARFTDTIRQCQVNCGDAYYTCTFETCPNILQTSSQLDTIDAVICCKQVKKPSFFTRFAYYSTFGLFGHTRTKVIQVCGEKCRVQATGGILNNANAEGLAVVSNVDTVESDGESLNDPEQQCHTDCTKVFHKCYHACICDERKEYRECNPLGLKPARDRNRNPFDRKHVAPLVSQDRADRLHVALLASKERGDGTRRGDGGKYVITPTPRHRPTRQASYKFNWNKIMN